MNNNLLKKLAAGATTVAMLASLGTVAFAADTEATGVVKDWQNANALDITSVTSIKSTAGSVTNYTVTVNYTGVADGAQVTVLGYLYDANDANLTAVPADSAIYAVNQEAKAGSTTITLSTDANGNGVKDGKDVTGNEILVIKMGSDSAGITAAQAVTVNLANATSNDSTTTKWAATSAELEGGAIAEQASDVTEAAILALLAEKKVTVKGANAGEEVTGLTATWELKSGSEVAAGKTATFVGTVTAGADDAWTGTATVEVDVTIASATTTKWTATSAELEGGAIAEQASDVTEAAILALLAEKKVTVKGANAGEEVTGLTATWELKSGSEVAAGKTATFVGTVTAGADDAWTGTATVEVDVVIKAAAVTPSTGLLGDVNGSGKVDSRDARDLGRFTAGWTGYDQIVNQDLADVNGSGKVDSRDARDLGRHTAGWTGYETLPIGK